MNLLFVCGRNRRRSPTAEAIFRGDKRVSVRSGGTSESSPRRVSQADLQWADLVCVMERKYESRLRARFPDLEKWPRMHNLDIPDDYEYMDPLLVDVLRAELESILGELDAHS
ncbi:MAG: phosphotyrosine protein phosphatase [Chthoniobacterales bacterium]